MAATASACEWPCQLLRALPCRGLSHTIASSQRRLMAASRLLAASSEAISRVAVVGEASMASCSSVVGPHVVYCRKCCDRCSSLVCGWGWLAMAGCRSEKEVYRRQDMLLGIRYRAKQMAAVLNTQQPSNRINSAALTRLSLLWVCDRKDLLERDGEKPIIVLETDQTAELENSGIIHLQKRIMKDQDEELVGLESTVASTKHIALAVNEELDLHSQLLDDLDRDVESTNARVAVAQRKLAVISKRSSRSCTFATMCLLLLAIICLVLVVLWLSKYL
eukprot:SM000001S04483  [mRNA]  locus=s1:412256:413897:- [translate_table: standard]